MIEVIPTSLDNVYEIHTKKFADIRGEFVKTFHREAFKLHGLECDFKESFYSVSHKNVLRGMHFQLPPEDHAKLVYVVGGSILDVALDISKDSGTFGECFATTLSQESANAIYIGRGLAHGFLTLSDSATVVYMTTTVHSPKHDEGVLWNSFGFKWSVEEVIMSERDKAFKPLSEF